MKDTTTIPYKIYLSEDELPRNWYNVRADMTNKPAPLLNPGAGEAGAGRHHRLHPHPSGDP